MKIVLATSIILCTLFYQIQCTEPTVQKQADTVEILTMPSAEEWISCAQTLKSYQAEQHGFMHKIGDTLNQYVFHTSIISTTLLLAFFGKSFSEYFDFNGLSLFATGSGAAYAIYAICNRMLEWVGRHMAHKADEDFYALESYIRNWSQHKEFTPSILHPLFDDLARDYGQHSALGVTREQATYIVENIIQTAELGQAMTESLGFGFKRSDDDDTSSTIIPLFLATRITMNLNLKDCILQCATNPQKAHKNQWEHIARQLGIIKQSTFMETLARLAQNYQWPISLSLGAPGGLVAGVKLSHYLTGRDLNYLFTARMLGVAGGVAALSLFFKLIIRAGSDNQWRSTHLLKFVMNWKGQKHNAPVCLHALFDQLHRLYLKNHRTLQLDPLFVDELYQIVLEAWMMAMVPNEPGQNPDTHNGTMNGTQIASNKTH